MFTDLVSIITPAYNSENTIAETIKSVKAQTYENWEMIIINDYSIDKTSSVVKEFSEKDARIRLVEISPNQGVAMARNLAIKKAKGRYIAFLDSDDLWAPDKLLKQIDFMREKGCYFSYTAYEIIDGDGESLNKVVTAPPQQRYKDLLKQNKIACLTVMIDRKEIGDIEMPSLKHEDFALWLTILNRGYVAYGLDENLAKYRRHEGSLSYNKFESVSWVWKIYRENQNLKVAQSLVCITHFIVRSLVKYQHLGLLHELVVFRKGDGASVS